MEWAIAGFRSQIFDKLEENGYEYVCKNTKIKKPDGWEHEVLLIINDKPVQYSDIYGVAEAKLFNFPYIYIRVEERDHEVRAREKKNCLKLLLISAIYTSHLKNILL